MRILRQTLQDHDLGHLRVIAELWGLDLPPGTVTEVAEALSLLLLDSRAVSEIVESLPETTYQVLEDIITHGGRVPFAELVVQHGPFREMGPGRRDREKPWREPSSPIEVLWYRGLIDRAFADTSQGPVEFAFIPTDLMSLLPLSEVREVAPPGKEADPSPTIELATSTAVDDATTLLAALRRRPSDQVSRPTDRADEWLVHFQQPASLELLLSLLIEEGMVLEPNQQLEPDQVRLFLDSPRSEALLRLLLAWQRSKKWNDLKQVPNLTYAKSDWPNDPLRTRQAVLELLTLIPVGIWWDFDQFLEDVRLRRPGFLRPAGDFDSWYLQDALSGAFLSGFAHWDAVEGALLRFMFNGPMRWLGAVDLGKNSGGQRITSFRLTSAAAIFFDPTTRVTIKQSTATATVRADGQISIPRQAVRAYRYQIARFTMWEPMDEENYHYRLTPRTLASAVDQGLHGKHIQKILSDATGGSLPNSLLLALKRWHKRGTEAKLDQALILRVNNPSIIDALQKKTSTSRYLKQVLSPTAVTVDERDWERLCAEALRLGILIDPPYKESSLLQ